VSGQLPVRDGALIDRDVVAQTEQVLANLERVLTEHGAHRGQVVKDHSVARGRRYRATVNEPHRAVFDEDAPALSACARLEVLLRQVRLSTRMGAGEPRNSRRTNQRKSAGVGKGGSCWCRSR